MTDFNEIEIKFWGYRLSFFMMGIMVLLLRLNLPPILSGSKFLNVLLLALAGFCFVYGCFVMDLIRLKWRGKKG